ncbi:hypothetical protein [Microbacterium maritypicum]
MARPDSTTNTSSASVSVAVPGVISQMPTSIPPSVASSCTAVVGEPASTSSAGSGS